jgi:UDP-glucose 4-epimerase
MSVVAVTGGSGFLGTALLQALKRAGVVARSMDIGPAKVTEVHSFTGSALSGDLDPAFLRGADTLVHLAWSSLPASANEAFSQDAETNLIGTMRLFEACHAAGVARIVFASSGGTVYGRARVRSIPEDAPLDPLNAYAAGKVAAEAYLRAFCHVRGMQAVIVRLANPYGPGQTGARGQGLVAVAMRRALDGAPIEVWGDGEIVRDYLYIDDVAGAFVKASGYQGRESVFNVGSGIGRSINDVLAAIERVVGTPLNIERKPGRAIDAPINVLDPSRAENLLGWRAETSFDVGLEATWRWMRDGV